MRNFFTMESSLEAECRFWNHMWISEEEGERLESKIHSIEFIIKGCLRFALDKAIIDSHCTPF